MIHSTEPKTYRLFIGNLSYDASGRELRDLFAGDCTVVDIEIGVDRDGKPRGRGWANVQLLPADTIGGLIKRLDRLVVRGRSIHVDLAAPRRNSPPQDAGTKLYVENLPYALRGEDLRWVFENQGIRVLTAEIATARHDGRSLGRGWILLDPSENAAEVIAKTNGMTCRTRRLRVLLATPPGVPRHASYGQVA